MARFARAVVPGVPHHVTQRGNRRQTVFFRESDYRVYLRLLSDWSSRHGVEVWAYCLMPNHVHLVGVPLTETGLARAIGEAHRRYTAMVNRRENWSGYLWQGRFGSCAMDETHLLAAVRHVEFNPVRAGLATRPEDYRWSSAAAHLRKRDDVLVKVKPMLERYPDWREYLASGPDSTDAMLIRRHTRTGRPLGDKGFVEELEQKLGRILHPQKRGPKPRGISGTQYLFPTSCNLAG
jgi:putative transposase